MKFHTTYSSHRHKINIPLGFNGFSEILNRLEESCDGDEGCRFFIKSMRKLSLSDKDRAYLLGLFFFKKGRSFKVEDDVKNKMTEFLNKYNLIFQFNLEMKPKWSFTQFGHWIFLFGILLAGWGIWQLKNNYISVGIGTTYMQYIISEGGTKTLFGLFLVIAALLRMSFETKVSRLIKWLYA